MRTAPFSKKLMAVSSALIVLRHGVDGPTLVPVGRPRPNPPPQEGEGVERVPWQIASSTRCIWPIDIRVIGLQARNKHRAPPLPLAGEGWGGGASARSIYEGSPALAPHPFAGSPILSCVCVSKS